ncbi:hypothetical protein [Candidatus Nanopusillus massiliensis]|uniref:hypothetical protein n=1 Tax=Candidatus Nanopusillus massiliensis TaxID=2897163 RepID=UPI0021112F86|nr:hypothetical protein [Candidatus Nanopusillus massiliensis]
MDYLLSKRENAKIEKIEIPNLKKSQIISEYNGYKLKHEEEIKNTIRLWPWELIQKVFILQR